MPFNTGPLTFTRLRTDGDRPKTCDETTLATLAEHSFEEATVSAEKEVESGFLAGEHLSDVQFSYAKNGYGVGGESILFALRIDTHRVPTEVKKSYLAIEEQAAAGGNPSGMLSKAQRREARDLVERNISSEIEQGKWRKSKAVQLLWHLPTGVLYIATASEKVVELVADRMREAFNVDCTTLVAGVVALQNGLEKVELAVAPAAYTKPAKDATSETPLCPWNDEGNFDFLGNEFLIWLWYRIEADSGIGTLSDDGVVMMLASSLDMSCAWGIGGKQSQRGDAPTKSIEARDALRAGMWPRKAVLMVSNGEHQWEFALQGDKWAFCGVKLPVVADAQSLREITEARITNVYTLARIMDAAMADFLKFRLSTGWPAILELIREWVKAAPGDTLYKPGIARQFLDASKPASVGVADLITTPA